MTDSASKLDMEVCHYVLIHRWWLFIQFMLYICYLQRHVSVAPSGTLEFLCPQILCMHDYHTILNWFISTVYLVNTTQLYALKVTNVTLMYN